MPLRYAINLLKVFVYYLLLFAFCRLVFLLYFGGEIIPQGGGLFFHSLWHALPLDISAASYLLFVPAVLLFVAQFFLRSFNFVALKTYLFVTSLVCIILSIAEIGIYREVHVKLYYNMLTHMVHPAELFRSVSFALLIPLLALIVLLAYFCIKLLNRTFPQPKNVSSKIEWMGASLSLLVFAAAGGLLVLGCRGGLQPIPINEGQVYFSHNQCVNDATVNPLWNIVHSYIENEHVLSGDAYKIMSDEDAGKRVSDLYIPVQDSTTQLFKTTRPNVCILILESWSADLINSCGGYQGLTPNFEKLVDEGFLFTNIKPSGHLSDQGIPAVLSGYPALPIGSAINQPERQVSLPCINNQLKAEGYYSSFFFGGQLIFGNIKAYIYRNQFDRVMEQEALPSSLPTGRLGVHDSIMLSIWRDSLNVMRPPFFSCLFTLSTHSPFDAPAPRPVDWGGMENAYLNTVVYADRQLGVFFEEAKKQAWYDNTIFILVADHSHNTPKNYQYDSPDFYHIPLLMWGGALKEEFRGAKDNRLASQTDIASTLLHQLHLNSADYKWSKNLANPYRNDFAFYTFNEGYGFCDSTGVNIWNKKFPSSNKNTAGTPEEKDVLAKNGGAMLQLLMRDFLSK